MASTAVYWHYNATDTGLKLLLLHPVTGAVLNGVTPDALAHDAERRYTATVSEVLTQEVRYFVLNSSDVAIAAGYARAVDGESWTLGYLVPPTTVEVRTEMEGNGTKLTTLLDRVTANAATLFASLYAMITGHGGTPKYTPTALEDAPGGNNTTLVLYPTFVTSASGVISSQRVEFFTNDFSERRMVVYETLDTGTVQEVDLAALGEDLILVFESSDKIDLETFRTFDSTLTITGESPGTIAFTPSSLLLTTENANAVGALRIESTGKVLWRGPVRITYVADKD